MISKDMWLEEINFEEKIDKKNTSKITRSLKIKGYYIMNDKIGEKDDTVNIFLGKLKEAKGISSGMSKADIVSVKKLDMENKKVSSFEISLTGP